MGFLGFFFILLPILAAIIGAIIALFGFIGVCLLLIGVTGIIMNKIYIKHATAKHGIAKPLTNTASIILGISFILLPLGYMLYGVITLLTK